MSNRKAKVRLRKVENGRAIEIDYKDGRKAVVVRPDVIRAGGKVGG